MENAVANAHCPFLQSSFFFTVLGLEPNSCILAEYFATEPPALPTLFPLDYTVTEGLSGAQRSHFLSCQSDFVINGLTFPSVDLFFCLRQEH